MLRVNPALNLVRLAVLVAFSVCLAASAQTPDPTPAWSYDPIAVGNQRAYSLSGVPSQWPYWRTDSPAAITLDGERWVIRRKQEFERSGIGWTRREDRRPVRFDTTEANVVRWFNVGDTRAMYPCRLDLPIPEEESAPCGEEGHGFQYSVRPDGGLVIGEDTVETSGRSLGSIFGVSTLAAGIGETSAFGEGGGEVRLRYAVVAGDSLGRRPAWFPASSVDPTPGWQYYPLAVGNEWQVDELREGVVETVRRRRVVGTAEVGGEMYFEIEASRAAVGAGWEVVGTERLRYDTLSARVVDPEGASLTPCPFDEPGALAEGADGLVSCARFIAARVTGPGRREQATGLAVESASFKRFEVWGLPSAPPPGTFAAGIGVLPDVGEAEGTTASLRYAAVRQSDGSVREVGTRYPVAADGAPGAQALRLTVSPNPTPGALRLAVEGTPGEGVTVEAFDVRGRRVWHAVLSPGSHRLRVDAARWAAGAYVVRATGPTGAIASAVVVRR